MSRLTAIFLTALISSLAATEKPPSDALPPWAFACLNDADLIVYGEVTHRGDDRHFAMNIKNISGIATDLQIKVLNVFYVSTAGTSVADYVTFKGDAIIVRSEPWEFTFIKEKIGSGERSLLSDKVIHKGDHVILPLQVVNFRHGLSFKPLVAYEFASQGNLDQVKRIVERRFELEDQLKKFVKSQSGAD